MAISATEKPLGKVFTSDYQLTISFQLARTRGRRRTSNSSSTTFRTPAPTRTRLTSSLAHPRQGRPHPIPGHRRPTAPHLPVNHRLRAARTGRRPRPHRPASTTSFWNQATNSAASKPSHDSPCENATPTSSACTCRKRFGRPVRSEGQRHRLARATQHRRQHPPHIRPARRHGRQRPPPIRLIPGQRRHPRHRHHRRPRRRAPHLRRDEHARRATDRIRRVQSENHRGNIPRRA